jgi:hypothetical protein
LVRHEFLISGLTPACGAAHEKNIPIPDFRKGIQLPSDQLFSPANRLVKLVAIFVHYLFFDGLAETTPLSGTRIQEKTIVVGKHIDPDFDLGCVRYVFTSNITASSPFMGLINRI